MSSKNDETTGWAIGIAFVGVALYFMAVIIFIAAAIFTAVLTVLSVLSLVVPLRWGKFSITPREGFFFLLRGVIGWFAFPILVVYTAPLFHIPIYQSYIIYLMMIGYILGSVGGGIIIEELKSSALPSSAPPEPPAPLEKLPAPKPKPFEFASWDDEEDR